MTLFLFLLCAVAAILLMGGYYTYRIAFYSPKKILILGLIGFYIIQ